MGSKTRVGGGVALLVQFLFRLSWGLAAAMAAAPAGQVTAGYYRVHLYVLLGLNSLAAAVTWSRPELAPPWVAILAAAASYLGAALWLYERRRLGTALLLLVAAASLGGAILAALPGTASHPVVHALDALFGGAVLGTMIAAMFLGHWYLNTPTMKIAPLQRLVLLMAGALAVRAVFCAAVTVGELRGNGWGEGVWVWFVALRWLAGLAGSGVVAAMTWQVLKIPNTQSATGILYVGVITTFLGELASLLLASRFTLLR